MTELMQPDGGPYTSMEDLLHDAQRFSHMMRELHADLAAQNSAYDAAAFAAVSTYTASKTSSKTDVLLDKMRALSDKYRHMAEQASKTFKKMKSLPRTKSDPHTYAILRQFAEESHNMHKNFAKVVQSTKSAIKHMAVLKEFATHTNLLAHKFADFLFKLRGRVASYQRFFPDE